MIPSCTHSIPSSHCAINPARLPRPTVTLIGADHPEVLGLTSLSRPSVTLALTMVSPLVNFPMISIPSVMYLPGTPPVMMRERKAKQTPKPMRVNLSPGYPIPLMAQLMDI